MWRSEAKGWEGAGATAAGPWLSIRLQDGASAVGALLLEAELRELLETEPAWTGARGEVIEGGGSVHPSLLLRNPSGSVRGGPPRSRGRLRTSMASQLQQQARDEGRGAGRPVPSAVTHTRYGHSLLTLWGAWGGGRGSP